MRRASIKNICSATSAPRARRALIRDGATPPFRLKRVGMVTFVIAASPEGPTIDCSERNILCAQRPKGT